MEEVDTFKYLGATITKGGTSEAYIRIRLATYISALIRLKTIWTSNKIGSKTKFSLYKILVLSILLYGCEAWTITEKMEKKIKAFENKAHRRLLVINYRDHKTNIYIKDNINSYVWKFTPLLSIIKKRKLCCFGHVSRSNTFDKIFNKEKSKVQDLVAAQRWNGWTTFTNGHPKISETY